MSPVDCLSKMSDIYNVGINEIVSGERATGEKFEEIAERNVKYTLEKQKKEIQKFEKRMILILILTTIMTMLILWLLQIDGIRDIIVLLLVIAVAFIANTLNIVALVVRKNAVFNS